MTLACNLSYTMWQSISIYAWYAHEIPGWWQCELWTDCYNTTLLEKNDQSQSPSIDARSIMLLKLLEPKHDSLL